jgi:hypothetical protein
MTKLRIKYGAIEVDYEGDIAFTKADLLGFLDKLGAQDAMPDEPPTDRHKGKNVHKGDGAIKAASVSDIAQKLDVKTGRELILAACADLHFLQHKSTFTVKDITASMREAKHFFKANYSNNFATALKRLVKAGVVRSLGGDNYSLGNDAIKDLQARLA